MPSVTEELRNEWRHYEDDGGDTAAIKRLRGQGFVLRGDWTWRKPTPDYVPTERDISALRYLVYEWDFGGIAPDRGT